MNPVRGFVGTTLLPYWLSVRPDSLFTVNHISIQTAVASTYLLGFLLSAPIRRRLHSRNLRPAVLAIAALTGVAAILRAVI